MSESSIFTIRPFAFDADLPALARLLSAIEAVDQEGEDVSEAGLRDQFAAWGTPPADGRWIAPAPDDPMHFFGWGSVSRLPGESRADIQVAVHPDWRRRGLGNLLLDRLFAYLREQGVSAAGAYAASTNADANAFLRARGFQPVAAYTEMRAPGERGYPAPDWPAGIAARAYATVNDLATLNRAFHQGYAGLWGHRTATDAQLGEWLADWTPDGIWLAFDGAGQVAGICRAELSARLSARRGQPTGYIDAPGVIPAYRDRGLYLPLLLTALAWLTEQQPTHIEMESWGDRPETLALYADIGFVMARQALSYRLGLR
ncbi:MAG TPA: GNAT family N-acetyltransferase [Ktedonobacterales bacterium]